MSSSFTDLNDSQAESEKKFVASDMMEVEDDNVYIERMATDKSENSGAEDQSEEKIYSLASTELLLERYYVLGNIKILTSGTSEIVKLTETTAKCTVMKTGKLII